MELEAGCGSIGLGAPEGMVELVAVSVKVTTNAGSQAVWERQAIRRRSRPVGWLREMLRIIGRFFRIKTGLTKESLGVLFVVADVQRLARWVMQVGGESILTASLLEAFQRSLRPAEAFAAPVRFGQPSQDALWAALGVVIVAGGDAGVEGEADRPACRRRIINRRGFSRP